MSWTEPFAEILTENEPLSRHTWLRVGGPARYFFRPRTEAELTAVIIACHGANVPMKVLGCGSNVLVSDEGYGGAVIVVAEPLLNDLTIEGNMISAGGGVLLSHLVSEAARAGLAGLETLVGIPGTVGGAIHGNSGGRVGDIGGSIVEVTALTAHGKRHVRTEDELSFSYRRSSVNELVVLGAKFRLTPEDGDAVTQRMRKSWIMKRATQPLADQSAGCVFRNPRGLSAGLLIEQCGLKGKSVGGATVSDRHANFIVTEKGATSAQVLELIEQIRSAVHTKMGVELELEINVW